MSSVTSRDQPPAVLKATTSLAIRDLQASQHQVIDQLKALQEAVAALNAASAHQQIPPPSAAPTGQKRGTR
jgi:hypothetical protein